MKTIRIPVKQLSLTDMEEAGWELGDDGREELEAYSRFTKRYYLNFLTERQQQVAFCLVELGMNRKETALHLMVSLQAVHQIILRMRNRLKSKEILL